MKTIILLIVVAFTASIPFLFLWNIFAPMFPQTYHSTIGFGQAFWYTSLVVISQFIVGVLLGITGAILQ